MRTTVVGGALQGVEAAYLAHKAGWDVLLIDKKNSVPASGLCDSFVQMDVTETDRLNSLLKNTDLIIPALENLPALNALLQWSRTSGVPLAFDADAYATSSSKLESNRLFARIGVPTPLPWPDCGFPLIAKPNSGSGSRGVRVFHNQSQLKEYFPDSFPPKDRILQEYAEGPSFSLEVLGSPGNYTTLQVTDLEMDAGYDCKRVLAPTTLSTQLAARFKEISVAIAEAIHLKALMDVEVILHRGQLKVLEIDARLPSQTPTAVYWSTGYNMLEGLAGTSNKAFETEETHHRGVVYEHIKVSPGSIEVCGEHIMADAGPLHLRSNFFGADEAITNYTPGCRQWKATLIITGKNRELAWKKRNNIIESLSLEL